MTSIAKGVLVRETPLFFRGSHGRLFGVLHECEPGVPLKTPFVFCHPFAEEKLWAHRVFVTFARQMVSRGHPVLRFDYTGNGDSEGDFSDFTVEVALEDIARAIERLKEATAAGRVGLLGLRLGATFAQRVAGNRADVDFLVLWAPIVDAARYMQELLRTNLTTQMAVYKEIRFDREALVEQMREGRTVNVDGYEVSLRLYEEMMAFSASSRPGAFAGPVLLAPVQPSDRPIPSREVQPFIDAFPQATVQIVREEPFWKEIDRFYDTAPLLAEATVRWLAQQ